MLFHKSSFYVFYELYHLNIDGVVLSVNFQILSINKFYFCI